MVIHKTLLELVVTDTTHNPDPQRFTLNEDFHQKPTVNSRKVFNNNCLGLCKAASTDTSGNYDEYGVTDYDMTTSRLDLCHPVERTKEEKYSDKCRDRHKVTQLRPEKMIRIRRSKTSPETVLSEQPGCLSPVTVDKPECDCMPFRTRNSCRSCMAKPGNG